MFHKKNKTVVIREDLQKYFEVVESADDGLKGTITCIHEDCQRKPEKRLYKYSSKEGWNSHVRHLKTQHGISKESLTKKKPGSKSIASFIVKKRKLKKYSNSGCYKMDDIKQAQFLTNLMNLVCIAGVPLNLVEHSVFMKFTRDLDKCVRLPSRSTVTRNICTEAKRIIKINMHTLAQVPDSCLHFSFDLWNTRNHKTVMGIKVHFIDANWKLVTFCLGFVDFDGKKDASEVRKTFLKEIGTRYKIRPEQVGFIMTDNARENVSAFGPSNIFVEDFNPEDEQSSSDEDEEVIDWENTNDYSPEDANGVIGPSEDEVDVVADATEWAEKPLVRLGCVNHALQLVIKECLSKNALCKAIQAQLDQLVAFFNRSNKWHAKLVQKTDKGLIKIGDTRWNGFLLGIRRILEKNFIAGLNSVLEEVHRERQNNGTIPDLITSEREIEMQELSKLLTPFLNLTNELQGDGVTSSLVILGITTLYKQIAAVECKTEHMRIFKSSLCLTLTERFAAKEQFNYSGKGARKNLLRGFENEAYILATILDPRWKLNPFQIALPEPYHLSKYVKSMETIKNVFVQAYRKESQKMGYESSTPSSPTGTASHTESQDFLSSYLPKGSSSTVSLKQLENEVEDYLSEGVCARSSDPLEYWRSKASRCKFPVLCYLARKYLSFPATSSSIERVFSVTGSFNRARRAKLSTKVMENFLLYREFRREQLKI